MKAALSVQYDVKPSDESYSENARFCVIDTLVGRYGNEHPSYNPDAHTRFIIKKLTREYIIDKLIKYSHVHNNPLDEGADMWGVQDGVTPTMLNMLCGEHNMSC